MKNGNVFNDNNLLSSKVYLGEAPQLENYPVVCECGLKADEIWGCQRRKCPFYPPGGGKK